MLENKKRVFIFIVLLFLSSCQKVEILDPIFFDYNQFSKISINAEKKNTIILYEPKFEEPFIDHSLENSPIIYFNNWTKNNIPTFGTNNHFEINVIDASVKKTEIQNLDSKKYEEKTIYLYEINYLVEFVVYDDSNFKLASTIVEANRTTTSGKYISLIETERLIEDMIYKCLKDFSNKAKELIKDHMYQYIL
ncbi:hypothetical protein OAJ89_05335 [Alphaproteobacteria bacterium]|nr:hypothetical protein [Alphaproteobacteria bacterium]